MSHEQTITLYQPLLHSIAYNFVRCKQDAEDIVQETFLKWLTIDHSHIENTKAFLIRMVTNLCMNHLNALKRKKEEYWDQLDLAEMVSHWKDFEFPSFDFDARWQSALKLMHGKLEPMERAVFMLKEGFNFDYEAIQETIGKKQDHCRQLFSRARKKLQDETHRITSDLPSAQTLAENFRKACDLGSFTDLIQDIKKN